MKLAFLFPGQGSQYPGMGKDFAAAYPIVRQTYEEADDLLGFHLSSIAHDGPDTLLTETRNSQLAIFVTSLAVRRVLQQLFPQIQPTVCAGLSLGEYSALTAAGYLDFTAALQLVHHRATYMNQACESHPGTMAAVIGPSAPEVDQVVASLNLPNDLWVANYNSPGQTVISGTCRGVEAGASALKAAGAKRVLPLQVHGAFHSGLMQSAMESLKPHVDQTTFKQGSAQLVMNVPGDFVESLPIIQQNLVRQVISPVRWEQSIRAIQQRGIDLFLELGGCGKTLSGMIRRTIGTTAPTLSLDKVEDLKQLEEQLTTLAS